MDLKRRKAKPSGYSGVEGKRELRLEWRQDGGCNAKRKSKLSGEILISD